MKEKKISFKEFKSRLGKCLEKVDYSSETVKNRTEALQLERESVRASETVYTSTSSHLKHQFSL